MLVASFYIYGTYGRGRSAKPLSLSFEDANPSFAAETILLQSETVLIESKSPSSSEVSSS